MARLACDDFGFDCDFETKKSSDLGSVLNEFARHMKTKHGIEYTREDLRHLPVQGKLI